MNPKYWKISRKLMLGMGAALFLAITTLSVINVTQLQGMMEQRVIQQELPNALESLKNAAEREVTMPIVAARSVARNTFINVWLSKDEPSYELYKIQNFLQIARDEFNADLAFIVSLKTLNYYSEQGLVETLNNSSRGWVDRFLSSGDRYRIELSPNRNTGKLMAFVNVRVTDDKGQVIAVAGLGQEISDLSDLISQFKIGKKGMSALVDPQGIIATHPDKSQIGRTLDSLIDAEHARPLIENARGFSHVLVDHPDGDEIYASLPVDILPGWHIVSSVPTAELYSGLWTASRNATLGGLLVGLLMMGLVVVLVRRISSPIRQIAASLVEIGQQGGDLTQRIDIERHDELGDLIRGFNQFMDKLHYTVSDVIRNNEQLSQSLAEVVQNMSHAASQANETQHNTDRVAAAVHQMSTTVQEIARNTHVAADASKDSENAASTGNQVIGSSIHNIQELSALMQDSTASVTDLAESVTRINAVLEVIRTISEQTNLLALNAAIEAARAGELGRGFAVVADEVRALAQKTQASTDEIHQTIEQLKQSANNAVQKIDQGMAKTQEGVSLAEQAGLALDDIRAKATGITDMNIQIATATEEQSTVTEDINMNVQRISELASSCAYQISSCDQECARISEMVDSIRATMNQFKV